MEPKIGTNLCWTGVALVLANQVMSLGIVGLIGLIVLAIGVILRWLNQ